MEIIMRKILTQQFMGVLAALASIILSITLYAYKSDFNHVEERIIVESAQRKKADELIRINIKETMMDHEKLHIEQDKSNVMLIKYLDQRFDDMEKLINKK